jgi:hypothetical protein
MALKLTGRNPARFEFDDGVSQTIVVIQPDDQPDAVRAKLQRVLDLEDAQELPARLPVRQPGAVLAAAKEEFEPLLDVAAAEAAVKAQPVGWESFDVEELPEA